jgi:hypothetical protein
VPTAESNKQLTFGMEAKGDVFAGLSIGGEGLQGDQDAVFGPPD